MNSSPRSGRVRGPGAWLLAALWLSFGPLAARGAGVTVITHGFNGDAQGWVLGMAQRLPAYARFPGTNIICYEIKVTDNGGIAASVRKVSGGDLLRDASAEIVIKLDWGDLAGFFSQYDTYEVAQAVVPPLLRTNFVSELHGHALAELPLHLVGHSRGGSLVCQMARLLGTNGVWVDHVTTLDPHPVNEDGNSDPLVVSDAPLRIYENVLFADNYYQDFDGYPHGQFMSSSYNRRLLGTPGGYSSAHSDMHLWYHATIDSRNPANDTEATLAAADRALWFTAYEMGGSRAGIYYSRIGAGDRLSVDQPAGPDTDRLFFGFNQRWELGAGMIGNRTALPNVTGNWPNLIQLAVGTGPLAPGQSLPVGLSYQWAVSAASNATVGIYVDADLNPFNGNERLLGESTVAGTTADNVGSGTLSVGLTASNVVPGDYSVFAAIRGAGRVRYLYAPQRVTLFSSLQRPTVALALEPAGARRVDISSVAGQRIVLETTADFRRWVPLATNWLSSDAWSYRDDTVAAPAQFYRAVLK